VVAVKWEQGVGGGGRSSSKLECGECVRVCVCYLLFAAAGAKLRYGD